MKIILASGSPRRKELLRAYGIEFTVQTSDADETIEGRSPEETVKELSARKAMAVWETCQEAAGQPEPKGKPLQETYQDAAAGQKDLALLKACQETEEQIILGADTVVSCDGKILGKPENREHAKEMLRMLSGRKHQVYTGVTLLKAGNHPGDICKVCFAEKTEVSVKALTDEEIEAYAATGECDDKAGAYAIQGIFADYIEGFDGDYNNVVGLPADRVLLELWNLGYHLPESRAKLVVTDIDGTLVKDSSPEVYPEMIETIRRLRQKGILFCIASGRQYASICTMFREVSDDIIFLCENGAHVVYHGEDLHVQEMQDGLKRELLQKLRTYGDDRAYVISTTEGSYLENPSESFEALIRDCYHNKYEIVDDFLALGKPSIKIAIYRKGSIRELGESVLIPEWKDRLKTCMAGEEWVDFMDLRVDKGNALRFLQEYFQVSSEETMVFGDNANDLGLLLAAAESYAVSNARPEIKEKASFLCPAYWHHGVQRVISDRILAER